jgi:hypothetical protein
VAGAGGWTVLAAPPRRLTLSSRRRPFSCTGRSPRMRRWSGEASDSTRPEIGAGARPARRHADATGIRDQLDTLLDEAARANLSARETLAMLCERSLAGARFGADPYRRERGSKRARPRVTARNGRGLSVSRKASGRGSRGLGSITLCRRSVPRLGPRCGRTAFGIRPSRRRWTRPRGDVRRVRAFSRHANVQTLLVYDDARNDHGGAVAASVAALLD